MYHIFFIHHLSVTFRLLPCLGASLVAQTVRHLSAMQETWVRYLGQKDPLEKEMAAHSSTLCCIIYNSQDMETILMSING